MGKNHRRKSRKERIEVKEEIKEEISQIKKGTKPRIKESEGS